VSGLTIGEMNDLIESDPEAQNGQKADTVVIARPATFQDLWERNRSMPWR